LADLQRTVYPHKWSPISCWSSAVQGKFAGQRPTSYTAVPRNTNNCCMSVETAGVVDAGLFSNNVTIDEVVTLYTTNSLSNSEMATLSSHCREGPIS